MSSVPANSLSGPRRGPEWPVLKPVGRHEDRPAVRLNRATCVVGDRSRVHLPLQSPLVSRSHALILVDEGVVHVRDLASRNRVFVNGSAVGETPLRRSDLLQIGPYQFRCHAGFASDDSAAPEPRASLCVAGSNRVHAISGRTFLIGRRPSCDLQLDSKSVSRVHAVIFGRSGRHLVRDLSSRAGTFLNGQRIREAELCDGDELHLPGMTFRYQLRQATGRTGQEPSEQANAADLVGSSHSQSMASALLSASGSLGAKTEGAITAHDVPPGGAICTAPAAAATADDFEFENDPRGWRAATAEHATDASLANVDELFPTEISLSANPTNRLANGNGSANGNASSNGNGDRIH